QAAEKAKAAGAKYLESDVEHGVDPSAARVWDALQKKGYPVEKLGPDHYRLDLTQYKAGDIKRSIAEPETEVNPNYHPDLKKVAEEYGVSDSPEDLKRGASFITPDGKFIHLPAGTEHPTAIERSTGERDVEDRQAL